MAKYSREYKNPNANETTVWIYDTDRTTKGPVSVEIIDNNVAKHINMKVDDELIDAVVYSNTQKIAVIEADKALKKAERRAEKKLLRKQKRELKKLNKQ